MVRKLQANMDSLLPCEMSPLHNFWYRLKGSGFLPSPNRAPEVALYCADFRCNPPYALLRALTKDGGSSMPHAMKSFARRSIRFIGANSRDALFAPINTYLSKSTYGSARAALFDLYRQCGIDQPPSFVKALKRAYGGLQRKSAQYKATSGARLGEGKKPLPFILYQKLCNWLISQGNKESIFAWSFLTITWNLMCRSKKHNVCCLLFCC